MILHHLSAVLHPGVSTVKADLQCLKLIHLENCLEHVDVSKVPPYLKKNTLPIATHGKIDFLFTHEFSRLGVPDLAGSVSPSPFSPEALALRRSCLKAGETPKEKQPS